MRILSLFSVMFALIGYPGTTIGGNEDKLAPAYLKQHLIIRKTTKAEVRQHFGTLDSDRTTVMASGKESWYYSVDGGISLVSLAGSTTPVTEASQAVDTVDKSSQKDSDSLMIFFDEKSVTENWVR